MTATASTRVLTRDQREVLASPLRIEIVGMFSYRDELSIADMAERMGVRAGSLYHHVGLLEKVGLLRRTGERRKGKRDEALFGLVHRYLEVPLEPEDGEDTRRTVAAAFRMAERDFAHALGRDDIRTEGPDRNLIATRAHVRASPRLLARINKHIDAILDVLEKEQAKQPKRPHPEGRHVSLTLALLPMRGRNP